MRQIKDLGIVHDTDYIKFPSGTIKNETDTEPGTPVIREIYGDILSNVYALLKDRKVAFNGLEDNELNGYQLLSALRKLVNELNDVEQILNKNADVWSVNLDFSILPNRYVFFARASETYVDSANFTIKGTGLTSYQFASTTGFNQGDEVLIVLDQAGVRAYNVSQIGGGTLNGEIFNVFGAPLQFNDSDKLWYQEEGKLFSDVPEIFDLQQEIRQADENPDLLIYEMFAIKDKIVCLTFDGDTKYHFWFFSIGNWNNPLNLDPQGFVLNDAADFGMHVYFDGRFAYLTNGANTNSSHFDIIKVVFDFGNQNVIFVSNFNLSEAFTKTTNGIASAKGITTLINGNLSFWGFDSSHVVMGQYNSYIGLLFKIKDNAYYSNGEVAKKWNLY